MDAARAAVSKITGRQGHRTDVDEVVNPAVVSETIKPHRHEETQEAIDREVHQHHYHTTVQPVSHKEQLPEKHVHNLVPQVEREFKHDNEQETHRRVSAEMAQFQNTSVKHQTTHSTQAAPQVVGEHVHHHVHETVQPVIHKETIQPEVVHTTVPIHEVHHESAQHHGMSALPMKTIDEFKQAGGMLSGSKSHTHEEYEGAPRPYNDKLKTTIENVLPGHHHTSGTTGTTGTGLTGRDNIGSDTRGTGLTGHNTTGTGAGLTGRDNYSSGTSGSGLTGHHNTPGHTGTGSGLTGREEYGRDASGYDSRRPDSGIGSDDYNRGNSKLGTTSSNTSGTHKPSLMDKLNPRVDATGDGKAGFMK